MSTRPTSVKTNIVLEKTSKMKTMYRISMTIKLIALLFTNNINWIVSYMIYIKISVRHAENLKMFKLGLP